LTLEGAEIFLQQAMSSTVGEVKERIEGVTEMRGKRLPVSRQRLVFGGQEISPDAVQIGTVANICDGATIHVVESSRVVDEQNAVIKSDRCHSHQASKSLVRIV